MADDGEQRFERWLLEIAKRLAARGLAHTKPTYDGRVLGERMALPWGGADARGELLVLRREQGARIVLLASSAGAAQAFLGAVEGMHLEVRRLHNAKRKFLHRVERMAEHLSQEFELRASGAPTNELRALHALFQEAQPLVGVEVKHPSRAADDDDVGAAGASVDAELPIRRGLQRRYRTRYAVTLPSKTGVRAALWSAARGVFVASPVSAREVKARLEAAQRPSLDFAIALLPVAAAVAHSEAAAARPEPNSSTQAAAEVMDATVDVVETTVEAANAAGACADIGSFDLPDCGSFDVPDCSF